MHLLSLLLIVRSLCHTQCPLKQVLNLVLKRTGHGMLHGFIRDESRQLQRADIHVLLVPGLGKSLCCQVVVTGKQGMTTVISPNGGETHVSGPSISLRADGQYNLFFMDFETPTTKKGSSPRFIHAGWVRKENPTTRQASADVCHRRQGHPRTTANHDSRKAENEDIEGSKCLH